MNNIFFTISNTYKSIAFLLLNTLILLFVLEVAIRIGTDKISPIDINSRTISTDTSQAPFFQQHPFAAFQWIPNARFGTQSVNKLGFVSTEEFEFVKNQGEIRIVTLGGSSTVGNGNVDKNTYPRHLQKLLRSTYPEKKITVINASAGGYSTTESLGYLNSRIRHLQPDIILIMHAWNDMYYFTLSDEKLSQWRENFNLQAMWNGKASSTLEDLMPAHIQYLSWSQLYLHIADWVRLNYKANKSDKIIIESRYEGLKLDKSGNLALNSKPLNPQAISNYHLNLGLIQNYCRDKNISCFSILQPTLVARNHEMDAEKLNEVSQTCMVYHAFSFEKHLTTFDILYEHNIDIFGQANIVDARVMSGKPIYFLDHIHQNEVGTLALANLVYDKIYNLNIFSEN